MNRNLHRIVFNRALGLFQAVTELARRDGPGQGGEASAAGSRFVATLRPLGFAVASAFGLVVIVPLANAQVVADPGAPGNQRPTVLEAASGVPLVNIQTPSAAGVSRNAYRQFDVGQPGVILNNSRTSAQTQLGGWVQGNPWLARGTARVILNEVNSSDPSRLNGYVEVAGDRAQLVIANPAGISCDGCGFINAERATITTGRPVINGGALERYRVQGGAIRVTGQGMDASTANYTDLIARSVEANAGIWARQLRIATGGNDVSADQAEVRKIAASGDAPAFALDVGALGGMYSQKIVLVGTEHGVGVRNAGTMGAQAGQLLVTADGRLENLGTMQASSDTRIDASGGLANAGTLSAGRELALDTPEDIDNRGGTLSARRIGVTAQSLTNREGVIGQTGPLNLAIHAGRLSNRDGGRIGLAAPRSGASSGNEQAPQAGAEGADGNGAQPDAELASMPNGALKIAGMLDNNGGRILAGGHIDLTASGGLDNDGGHLGALQLEVSGGDFSNRQGEIRVAAGARIAASLLSNDAGLMQVHGPVSVSAQDFSNRAGTFRNDSRSDTSIRINGRLNNSDGGLLVAGGDMTAAASVLDNRDGGLIVSTDGDLSVATRGHTGNAGGALRGAGNVILANGGFGNAGGMVLGASVAVDTRLAALDNARGTIATTGGLLDIDSGALNNAGGLLQSRQGMRVDTHGQALINADAGETGGILSLATLALNSGNLTNRDGVVHSGKDLIARVSDIDNTGGLLGGRADVDIGATSIDNARGRVQAGNDLKAFLRGHANNDAGLMVAGHGLTLGASQILNRDTQSAKDSQPLGLQADSVMLAAGRTDNTAGVVAADSRIVIRGAHAAGELDNARGHIASGGSIDVAVSRVLNPSGTLIAGKLLNVAADTLDGDGSLLSRGDLRLSLRQDFTHLREITANGHARISTAGLLINHGVLQAGDLDVRGADVINSVTGKMNGVRATVAAQHSLTNRGLVDGNQTHIEAGTLDNAGSGRLYGDQLAIQAATVVNREEAGAAAVIAARQRLDIGARFITNREQALIFSAGGGGDALNIGGTLDVNGHAAARADLVRNDSATIESLGGLTLDSAGLFNGNLHFRTELARISGPTRHLYIQPEGDPEKHDAGEYRWESWSRAGRYRHRETGAKIHDWTQYDIAQTEYETQVRESAPALIRAGGNMTLRGDQLVNDKSRIMAGGALHGDLDRIDNVAALGEHTINRVGTSQYTYSKWHGGFKRHHKRKWDGKIAYAPVDLATTIELGVSRIVQNAAGAGSGFAVTDRQDHRVGPIVGGGVRAAVNADPAPITDPRTQADRTEGPGIDRGTHAAGGSGPATARLDTAAPANSLFRVAPNARGYLVETDPRFTDYRNWLSSDYMLSQLGHDPALVHKRLGDGFYEQQLVRDQIGQLTGRRFLGGYASDEAQFQALLDAGVTYAKEWSLRPGVALSARQMAQLTSDIVWLVERDVTLADGSITRALVPQVYVRVRPGDIDGNGSLLAANSIDLNLKGDLVSSGAIAGRAVVSLSGENLRILGGRITADAVALSARADIDNIGGTLDAGSTLRLGAGRDLNVVSTARGGATRAGRSDFSRTSLDRVAGLYVTNPNGLLLASAGRDAKLIAARVGNRGKDGQTAMAAGRDLTLGTVTIAEQENNVRNASNYLRQGYEQDVGSTITTAGDVRLQAGRDLSSTAGAVTSEQGALVAVARGEVNILAGKANRNWAEGRRHSSRSLLGSSTKTTRDSLEETTALPSTFSGNTVAIRGENVNLTGSNVVSDAGTAIVANNNLTLLAATEARQESHFKENRKSGFLYNGGLDFTIGSQMQSGDRRDASTHAAASTAGSTAGDVTLAADGHYQQTGSHILAPKGAIDIHAKKVDIVDARETGKRVEQSKFRQSGLTVALSAPVLSAIETAGQMKRAAGQTTDGRMQVLAGAATGLAAKNAYDAVQADPQSAGGVNISITVGASKSDSKSTATTDTAAGSAVAAGGDVRIDASGGPDSNLTVRGSDIRAGGDAVLKADGDINLLAAQNTIETRRTSSNSSAGVGVAIAVGQGGAAMGVTANASVGRGKGEGKDVTWTNSHVTAGERLILGSGGDTRLRGAVASGRQVMADVGGNLSIESLQDTSTFRSKDTNVGGSVTVGAGFSGSVNLSQQKIHSDYASVTEQSRIEAGEGGFQIRVRDNTDLRGAAITSSEKAVRDGLNTLTTGTLTTSDISNHAEYSASGISVGGGYSTGNGDRKETGPGGGVGTNQQGQAATGGQVPGSTLPTLGNFSASLPVVMAASGNSASATRSGISGARLTITNELAQQALSGKSVDEMMAGLNRDVFTGQDGANALKPIFNEQEIRAGFEIVGALTRETGTLLNNMAKKADVRVSEAKAAEAMAADPGNGLSDAQRQALRDQAAASYAEARNIDANWGAGGTYRQIAAALTAAAGGNVTGTTSQFAQNMLVNYVQQQGAGYVGKLVANGTLTEGSALHASMHAIVACAGAAASSQSCTSAALGASASSLLTGLFGETTPDEKATEREAKRNLIVSIVTGIGAAGGLDAAPASTAAATAVDNNWLATQQIVQMNKELAAADGMLEYLKIQGKWVYISGKQDVLTTAGIGKGLALAGWDDVKGLAAFLSDPIAGLNGIKELITDPDMRKQLGDSLVAEFDAKIARMRQAIEVGGTDHALQLGEDLGNLAWQVGTAVTGVGTAAKGGIALAKAGINVSAKTLDVMKLGAQLLKAEGKGLGGTVSMSEIGMQWGKGIEQQGKPFEAFVQAKLPPGTSDLNTVKKNFSTFDHLTPDGTAISTKTLDTGAKTYQQPVAITRTLNKYVDDMVEFTRDGAQGEMIYGSSFAGREMHLAVPASTTAEQFSAIAKTIEYAKQFDINIVVTKVR